MRYRRRNRKQVLAACSEIHCLIRAKLRGKDTSFQRQATIQKWPKEMAIAVVRLSRQRVGGTPSVEEALRVSRVAQVLPVICTKGVPERWGESQKDESYEEDLTEQDSRGFGLCRSAHPLDRQNRVVFHSRRTFPHRRSAPGGGNPRVRALLFGISPCRLPRRIEDNSGFRLGPQAQDTVASC